MLGRIGVRQIRLKSLGADGMVPKSVSIEGKPIPYHMNGINIEFETAVDLVFDQELVVK